MKGGLGGRGSKVPFSEGFFFFNEKGLIGFFRERGTHLLGSPGGFQGRWRGRFEQSLREGVSGEWGSLGGVSGIPLAWHGCTSTVGSGALSSAPCPSFFSL